MAFKRIKGSDRGLVERTISGVAYSVGDLLQYSRTAATVVTADANTEIDNLAGVVVKATTTADTVVLLQRIMPGDVYEVDTLNAANVAHNYMRCIWGAGHTINNTGTDVATDTGLFMQTGKTGTNKVIGEFVTGSTGD
jgi:hypothetical protein